MRCSTSAPRCRARWSDVSDVQPPGDTFRPTHMHFAGQAELAGLGLRFAWREIGAAIRRCWSASSATWCRTRSSTPSEVHVVAARSTLESITIEAWDTGQGIAPGAVAAHLRRVLPDRARRTGPGPWPGDGPAIVKRLANLLNHRLTVSSRLGWHHVPSASHRRMPELRDAVAPADTIPYAGARPQMVLVIDDEEPIRLTSNMSAGMALQAIQLRASSSNCCLLVQRALTTASDVGA